MQKPWLPQVETFVHRIFGQIDLKTNEQILGLRLKLLVFFLYFLPKAHSMVYQELGQCLPVNTGQLMLMAVRRSTTNQSAAIHILLSLVYITPPRVANLIAFIRYIAQP